MFFRDRTLKAARTGPAAFIKFGAVAAVLSLTAVACGGTKDTGFPGTGVTPTGATPTSTGATTQAEEVEVGDIFFRPQEIRVKVGAKVTWEHIGNQPHTVTADDGAFDSSPGCPSDTSKCMQNGNTFEQVFSAAGRIPYYCKVHGGAGGIGQSGVIIVEA